MDRPGAYSSTPFVLRLVLLCSDCVVVLQPISNEEHFELIDKIGFTNAAATDLETNVSESMWSLAHTRTKQLHTFRHDGEDAVAEKKKWVDACKSAMEVCQFVDVFHHFF
jgi:hypothetical protein